MAENAFTEAYDLDESGFVQGSKHAQRATEAFERSAQKSRQQVQSLTRASAQYWSAQRSGVRKQAAVASQTRRAARTGAVHMWADTPASASLAKAALATDMGANMLMDRGSAASARTRQMRLQRVAQGRGLGSRLASFLSQDLGSSTSASGKRNRSQHGAGTGSLLGGVSGRAGRLASAASAAGMGGGIGTMARAGLWAAPIAAVVAMFASSKKWQSAGAAVAQTWGKAFGQVGDWLADTLPGRGLRSLLGDFEGRKSDEEIARIDEANATQAAVTAQRRRARRAYLYGEDYYGGAGAGRDRDEYLTSMYGGIAQAGSPWRMRQDLEARTAGMNQSMLDDTADYHDPRQRKMRKDQRRVKALRSFEEEKEIFSDPRLKAIEEERRKWLEATGQARKDLAPSRRARTDLSSIALGGGDMGPGMTPEMKHRLTRNNAGPSRSARIVIAGGSGMRALDQWFAENLEKALPQLARQGVITFN